MEQNSETQEINKLELNKLIDECVYCKSLLRKQLMIDFCIIITNAIIIYALFVFKPSIIENWLRFLCFTALICSTYTVLRYGVSFVTGIIDYFKLNVIHNILLNSLNSLNSSVENSNNEQVNNTNNI